MENTRTEKITYETIDGKNVKILRIFIDGVEKKKAIMADTRIEEKKKSIKLKEKKDNEKLKQQSIEFAWKKATTTDEKINILGYVLGLNEKL